MCEVAERLVNEGLEKGRAEGLAEGLEKVQTDVITRLIKKGKTSEEIHELLDFSLEDILRI